MNVTTSNSSFPPFFTFARNSMPMDWDSRLHETGFQKESRQFMKHQKDKECIFLPVLKFYLSDLRVIVVARRYVLISPIRFLVRNLSAIVVTTRIGKSWSTAALKVAKQYEKVTLKCLQSYSHETDRWCHMFILQLNILFVVYKVPLTLAETIFFRKKLLHFESTWEPFSIL